MFRCGQSVFKVSGGLHSETQAGSAGTAAAAVKNVRRCTERKILPTTACTQELAHADYLRGGSFWRVIDTVGLNDTGLSQTEASLECPVHRASRSSVKSQPSAQPSVQYVHSCAFL